MRKSGPVLFLCIALSVVACDDTVKRPDASTSVIDATTPPPSDGATTFQDTQSHDGDAVSDGLADGPGGSTDGGVLDGSGRDGDSAARDAGATDGDAGSIAPAPTIPDPDGECPTLGSGTETIKDLETDIVAGSPGASKGPLLFTWHGTGGNGSLALRQVPSSTRNDITAQGGMIIAPSDNGETRVGYSPNGVWYETSDLEYADHIVACAVAHHNIDPRRIYVTGCSAGGLMAAAMAIKRSAYVAAAYPNSGGLVTVQGVSLQDPGRVPAVITMHGGQDDTVIVNFQQTSARFQDFIGSAGGFGVDCNHESGHCGAPTELLESAWAFVKAHPFGTAPSPYAGGLPEDFPNYCVIWGQQ